MDHNRPEVDENEQADVDVLLKREQEREQVVRNRLRESVKRVEGVAGERSGHDPLVVRLVKVLVDPWVVQTAVNPVDAEVGEADEHGHLGVVVPHAGAFLSCIVDSAIAALF